MEVSTRISAKELPADVLAALERGDSVELESDGVVIGNVTPTTTRPVDWAAFWEARRGAPALDYEDFLRDLEMIRNELNSPAESRWPS